MKGIYLTGVTVVAAFALPALVAVLSYLLGCINGAIATSHLFYHDDVRRHGSGNAGLTNFYRNYGAKCAPMVIAFDMLKAVGAVLLGNYFLGYLLGWGAAGKYFGALFCVIGHMFPVFYGFKGGKGILSGGTIVWMIDWRIGLVVWVGFLLLFLLTKYVSLGSVWAGASFPFATWYFYPDPVIVLLAFLLGALILWKHRSNIVRLIHGNENKFSVHRKKN